MGNNDEQRDLVTELGAMVRGLDKVLGLQLIEASGEGVRATLEITSDHHQPFGIVHGGVYCAIAESAASISAFCWLQETEIGGTAVGVNNNTDFLRSVSAGTMTLTTVPVHRGRRQQLWQVDIADADGRLLAQSRVRLQNVELPSA
ncbi:PaaI family thioesterase [Gordonia phosphorivorans]|uniref:PaaI family thioesterase n=1 Tax=Gordonia phosphorivorans TaxID=1056982 RepID=A0ABV6H9J9_9ACTN